MRCYAEERLTLSFRMLVAKVRCDISDRGSRMKKYVLYRIYFASNNMLEILFMLSRKGITYVQLSF